MQSYEERQAPDATRRGFLTGAIYAIWGVISAALAIPAFAYLFFPPKARKRQEWVDAGDASQLVPNRPVEMVFRRNRTDGWKIISERATAWAVGRPDGGVTAFGPQCTHLGCAYHWDESKSEFICPCHNSIFAIDGKVVSGPAPRPLDRYDAKIENGKLMLGRLHTPEKTA